MNAQYSEQLNVMPSRADDQGMLSIASCFDLFMDIATQHAENLGIGLSALTPRNQFWLTVKTKVRFLRRPRILQPVTLTTWPEPAGGMRCMRDYRLSRDDEILALGKTEWAVMDLTTGRLVNTQQVYPKDLTEFPDTCLPEPFERFRGDTSGDVVARHTITSNDIDLGRHMNNVAYLRALLESFSTQERHEMKVHEIELQFLRQCFEGDELCFYRKDAGETSYYTGCVNDKICILIIIRH